MLSVILANVYPEFYNVEFAIRNLAAQTCQDFETILIDAYYDENNIGVADLCQMLGFQVTHAPACADQHVGHWCHWELHSNSLLLAGGDWVMHFGVKRYLHRQAIATVVNNASLGVCTVFDQIPSKILGMDCFYDIEKTYAMSAQAYTYPYLSQSGFFSIPIDTLIGALNGHNEALVLHHWVDSDLSARAHHLPLKVEMVPKGLLRITNRMRAARSLIGMPVCNFSVNPHCVARLIIAALKTGKKIDVPVERFRYQDWEWLRCPECGIIGVENEEAYISRLWDDESFMCAPIGIAGIGRNIARLQDDLKGLTLSSRLGILSASHDNPRYLEQ